MEKLQVTLKFSVNLYCDNKVAINISFDPVQDDRTKHIEMDRHFIKENFEDKIICMTYVPTTEQTVDIFTKGLPRQNFNDFIYKLDMINIYNPT